MQLVMQESSVRWTKLPMLALKPEGCRSQAQALQWMHQTELARLRMQRVELVVVDWGAPPHQRRFLQVFAFDVVGRSLGEIRTRGRNAMGASED